MRTINHAGTISCAFIYLQIASASLLLFATYAGAVNVIEEQSVVTEVSKVFAPSNPLMRNDSLIYSIDIVFEHFTGKFWSYMDNTSHVAFIEIYGIDINSPAMHMPHCSPLKNMSIKNQKTKMSLSGKMSTISFNVDRGWNFDAVQADTNKLRLIFGKKMEIREVKESLTYSKKTFLSVFAAVFSGAVAVSILVAGIITNKE